MTRGLLKLSSSLTVAIQDISATRPSSTMNVRCCARVSRYCRLVAATKCQSKHPTVACLHPLSLTPLRVEPQIYSAQSPHRPSMHTLKVLSGPGTSVRCSSPISPGFSQLESVDHR